MKKASITIYLSLMLVLIVTVISASIVSVKVQAGRSRVANGVDQAMFSLFAQYDRDLLEKYDVFFIDGAVGSGKMQIGAIYDRFESALEYILKPNKGSILGGRNLLSLSLAEGAVTGYTLATDACGEIYASQAVDYMKETAGIQGVSLLLGKYGNAASAVETNNTEADVLESLSGGITYSDLEAESEEAKRADAEEAAALEEEGIYGPTEAEARAEAVPDDFVNPLPFISELRSRAVLDLVVGGDGNISEKTLDGLSLASSKAANTGIGVIDVPEGIGTFESHLLYDEYILTHFGSYTAPRSEDVLSYQAEYILQGKGSDRENLEEMVTKLLAIREAANIVYLYTDPAKTEELEAASGAIAALLFIPLAEPVIKALLAAGWAFCESLVDVRGLLHGRRVPVMKSGTTWQVSLAGIPSLLEDGGLDAAGRDDGDGMSYQDYLRIFLVLADSRTQITRSLDMVEANIRKSGRDGFRINCCIESLTVEVNVRSENRVTLTEEQTARYRDFVKS
ncbi:MAG: DUF5702 domain-containing protein [Lachnospiraceae bacterium]|nr:DUF5702 domain-containing protein [Lachnospiraceae bacterium]